MTKDIREVLFNEYSKAAETADPSKLETAFLIALRTLDNQTFDLLLFAATDLIKEHARNAYMAGFEAGATTCRTDIMKRSDNNDDNK